LIGVAAGLAGVAVIAQPDPANLFTAEVIGMGFVLGAAASVALGSVLLRRVSPSISISAMTAWAMLVGGLMLHVGSVAIGEGLADVTPSFVGIVSVVYLAVFASAVAYVIYFTLLKEFGPLEINLVSYVVPVFATGAGIVLLGESFTIAMVGGFALIAGGFFVVKGRSIADELGYRF